jgi:hypothetical protein
VEQLLTAAEHNLEAVEQWRWLERSQIAAEQGW